MFSIETVIMVVLFLLGCGAIFGLLLFLINYCEKEFPIVAPFARFARIFLMIAVVLILIGLILDMMGHPIIAWRPHP